MRNLLSVSALAATLITGTASAQELPKTSFNVVGSIGTLSMYVDKEKPFWTKTIPEKSNNAITAQVKPFTELGFKGGEIFRLVSKGTLQVATTVLAYNSGEVPMNEAADLVGLVSSVKQLHEIVDAFRPTYSDFLEKEHGIKLIGFGTYQAQVIYCRDKFESIADIKGRKVRASGASQQAFVDFLGGSPITIAFAEVQPALAGGVVDCAITGALSGYKAKWHESAKFISPMPITYGLAAHMANLKWWNSLDPSVQAFLEENVAELETSIFELAATETKTGLACNTTGPCSEGEPAGMTLVPVSDADEALRKEALTSVILPAFSNRCGPACTESWNNTIGKFMNLAIAQ